MSILNEEPPLNRTRLLALSFAIVMVSIMIFTALHFSKIDLVEKEISLSRCFLIAQAPPYIYTEKKVVACLSAYNPVEAQCDSTPDITASGKKVRVGYVANNCLPFGTIVKIDGEHYEVQDRMNKRYGCEHFDILMWDEQEAIAFGRQIKEITYYKLRN